MTTNYLATGQHLLVDACGVNRNIMFAGVIERFFADLVKALEMKKLGWIKMQYVDEPDNRGLSAFQMITTSHISFHADEIDMGFYLDVMSCKPFDNEKVLALVRETFEPQKLYSTTVTRELNPKLDVWRDEAA